MFPWTMQQYRAWSGCFGSRHGWRLCLLVVVASLEVLHLACGGENVFKPTHASAGESTKVVELHEDHESEVVVAQAQKSCSASGAAETVALAIAGENKGIVGLHEVNESDRFGTDAAFAAATAGESEGSLDCSKSLSLSFHLSRIHLMLIIHVLGCLCFCWCCCSC